jgi:SpoVK/Ycf46/Vps4 family AAA+-type ATPase
MSTIGSKWFGEGEKYVRAVFTLASKLAPVVLFIDEVLLPNHHYHHHHQHYSL